MKPIITICFILSLSVSVLAQPDTLKQYNQLKKAIDTIKSNNEFSYRALLNYKKIIDSKEMSSKNFKGHDAAMKEYKQYKKELIENNANYRYVTNDNSFFGEMQRTWKANQAINYCTPFGFLAPVGTRRVALREGEGIKNLYLLEANMDHRYTLNMGRPHAPAWRRRTRTTFDYKVNFRMTLDDSSPIVPYSNDVGISVESAIWDSYRGSIFTDKLRFNFVSYDSMLNMGYRKHSFITALFQLHHYSNGQEPGSTYTDNNLETRNDYRKGDFSTNYLRARLTWSKVNLTNNSLFNIGIGFRADMGSTDGMFVYTAAQDSAYGKRRMELMLNWYSRIYTTKALFRNRENKWQLHLRADGDLILDKNLQNFVPNLVNSTKNYRLGTNVFAEIRPLSHRTIGYIFHFYYGRDYMNIRYDDIVWSASLGLSFSLDKYYPAGWTPERKIPMLLKLLH